MHKIIYESNLKGMSHFQDPDVNGRGIQREVLQKKKESSGEYCLRLAHALSSSELLHESNRGSSGSTQCGERVSLSTISFHWCSLKLIS